MTRKQNVPADAIDRSGNLLALALLAPIVGAAAGLWEQSFGSRSRKRTACATP